MLSCPCGILFPYFCSPYCQVLKASISICKPREEKAACRVKGLITQIFDYVVQEREPLTPGPERLELQMSQQKLLFFV